MFRRISLLLEKYGLFALAVAVVLLALPAYLRTAQTAPAPVGDAHQESAVALRILFGVQRIGPKTWDGEMTVDRGAILRLSGVYFEHADAIIGPNRWKCTSRATTYADSRSPRGYDPVHTHPWELIPNGIVATVEAPAGARVQVSTVSGNFSFTLDQLSLGQPLAFLEGDVTVERLPPTVTLTLQPGENDYPALAVDARGDLWASWISYSNRADSVWVAHRGASGWEPPQRVSGDHLTDNFRTALAEDGQNRLWVVWSGKGGGVWGIYGRYLSGGRWSDTQQLTGAEGPNLYHTLVRDARGKLHLVWQGFRGRNSEILMRTWDGAAWSPETLVSTGPADNWVPAAAADSKGNLWIGWDGYENGNFDIYLRRLTAGGALEERRQITRSPGYDANVSLACDRHDRLWISWDAAEVNWGKDWNSQHFSPRGGNGLYRTRAVRIACLDAGRLMQPAADIMQAIPAAWHDYFQMARLQADASGRIWAVGRSLTSFRTRVQNNWGANGMWEVLVTRLDGNRWMPAVKLDSTAGRNDERIAGAVDPAGRLWFAWAGDGRAFGHPQPATTEVAYTSIQAPAGGTPPQLVPFAEPPLQAAPVHPNEPANVAAIRGYRYRAGSQSYRILRGDLHRHTDISPDGIGDGSLLDFYRYAFTAGQYDYMVVTDHQYGGTEYNWWRTEKSEDAFLVPGRFWPLFGTERSVPYPNGHRNTFFAQRGNRELPISPDEMKGKINTGPVLYPYLRKLNGLTSSHSTASDQGTDWRDNDPQLEPLVEIYQGLNSSYEYENAPRADTPERRYYHHGEPWRPAGFIWNAWAKGLKLGVQASSDHIATHDSYACLLVPEDRVGREGLLDAMRARHSYAATDNIIVDVRIGEHLMGDVFPSREIPVLNVKVEGTGPIDRIELIKNNTFVHTVRPGSSSASFEYRDNDIKPGESYYYVRVEQTAGQLAWSSPIWVDYAR
ncbi:MAG TPA: hypothetical protein VFA33_03415 [Bryobacteraceae bacterium]|nr:hypothetical protein [Bryobacteraceae bacterium]